jgi:DeoR family transcriptional regulator, suf operon transcriptional repressor
MLDLSPTLAGHRGLRTDLLVALKKAQPLTAHELAGRFGVTANALRRHLKALEEDGVVQYRREVRGVGGPVFAYSLSAAGEALFPHAYASALNAALEALVAQQGVDGVIGLFRRQWSEMVADVRPRLAELPLAERAQLIAELRTSQGYMAEAEVLEDGGALVREHHCAIRKAAERFPEICAAELAFFEDVLGATVERRSHILEGCNRCEYRVHPVDAGDASTTGGPSGVPSERGEDIRARTGAHKEQP